VLLAGLVALGLLLLWALSRLGQDGTAPEGKPAADPGEGREPFVTNSIGMKLKRIGPGKFLMGTPGKEWGGALHEEQHPVELTRAFYIGVYEVIQAEYEKVMGTNPSYLARHGGGKDQVAGEDTSRFPVDSVSWDDAQKFCRKLSQLDAERRAGRQYRLPTEAEWEYACRAGTTSRCHFDENREELGDYAWYQENAGGRPHPVGLKGANPWGLHDMYGNVWEWCADSYHRDYCQKSPGPAVNPFCEGPTVERILRGGGWGAPYGAAWWCRSARRGKRERGAVENYHGLRVVFTAPGGAP
jgi:formylglycine-generating enzyme required for sulfatase activity